MNDLLGTFLLLTSLLAACSYLCFGLLGFISYYSVSHPRERDAFGRVFFYSTFLFSVIVFLLFYYLMGYTLMGSSHALAGLAFIAAFSPVAIFYLVSKARQIMDPTGGQ